MGRKAITRRLATKLAIVNILADTEAVIKSTEATIKSLVVGRGSAKPVTLLVE